jgi:(p)ppGpp synthase/HD superfamily hydrolase
MAHIYKDKYIVQDFISLSKENKMMSVHTMILKIGSLHICCQLRSSI